MKKGFTLIEVLTVVILIGILSALAYSSMMELIFTNRAKETAQTIRTFTERSIADAKRQNKPLTLKLNGNDIIAEIGTDDSKDSKKQPLSGGFSSGNSPSSAQGLPSSNKFGEVKAEPRIGISSIIDEGYFSACDLKGYCGGAVKTKDKNSFEAYIKRPKNDKWEAL